MEKRVLIIVLLTLAFAANAGKVQRWVDEDGQVHFGDAPPATAETTEITIRERSKGDASDLERLYREYGRDPFHVEEPEVGMVAYRVLAIWGEPTRRDMYGKGRETWEYDRRNNITSRVIFHGGYVTQILDAPAHERHLQQRVDQSTGAPPQAHRRPPQTP